MGSGWGGREGTLGTARTIRDHGGPAGRSAAWRNRGLPWIAVAGCPRRGMGGRLSSVERITRTGKRTGSWGFDTGLADKGIDNLAAAFAAP